MFLTDAELVTLTGRKIKSLQIEALRKMGLTFWVNAAGRPVVARATIEGKKVENPANEEWTPAVLAKG
jgi:hypothetical protein